MHTERRLGRKLRKHSPSLSTAALALVVLMLCPRAWGQAVTATLLGTVTDNTGAAVPGANVQILEKATGIPHTGTANESGNYTFPDLSPGGYSVSADAKGFKKEVRSRY